MLNKPVEKQIPLIHHPQPKIEKPNILPTSLDLNMFKNLSISKPLQSTKKEQDNPYRELTQKLKIKLKNEQAVLAEL